MSADDVGEIAPTSSGAALGPAKRAVEGKQVRGKGIFLLHVTDPFYENATLHDTSMTSCSI